MSDTITTTLKRACTAHMRESVRRIRLCLIEINDDELWQRPNSLLTSLGNLVLHLCGNIRQYAISSLGNLPDNRKRAEEFTATGGHNRYALLHMLQDTVEQACATIALAEKGELERTRKVQGFSMSGVEIMIHVTEHLSYHTGQITYRTKQLRNKDLGYYGNLNLDVTNNK